MAAVVADEAKAKEENVGMFRKHQDLLDLLSFATSFGSEGDSASASNDWDLAHKQASPPPEKPEGRSMVVEDSLVSKASQEVCHPKDTGCHVKPDGSKAKVDRAFEIDASVDEAAKAAEVTPKEADQGFLGIFKRLWWF